MIVASILLLAVSFCMVMLCFVWRRSVPERLLFLSAASVHVLLLLLLTGFWLDGLRWIDLAFTYALLGSVFNVFYVYFQFRKAGSK